MKETKNQTSSPIGWLCMHVWRVSLQRMKSAIISWTGSFWIWPDGSSESLPCSIHCALKGKALVRLCKSAGLPEHSPFVNKYPFHMAWHSYLNHVIRLWYFSSSVNSYFRCSCAAILFLVGPLAGPLARLCCADAQTRLSLRWLPMW